MRRPGLILSLLTRRAGVVMALVLLLVGLALATLVDLRSGNLRLEVDPSADRLLPEDDPERLLYDRARRLFGGDEPLVIALGADDVFTPDLLARIERIGSEIEVLPAVREVLSVVSALDVRVVDDALEIAPFVIDIPRGAEELAALRQRVLEHPLYGSSLVSADGRATAILVHLADLSHREYLESGIGERIEAIARAHAGDAELWIAGSPRIRAELGRVLLGETFTLSLGIGLALAAVLLLSFRSLRGLAIPIATIAIAVLWTLGLVVATGHALTAVTALVPPLLTAIGLSYAVHVTAEAAQERTRSPEATTRDVVETALGHTALPILLTGVTTAAGLASLLLSPLPAVREFGLYTVAGVGFAVLATLLFTPAALVLLGVPPSHEGAAGRRFDELAARLARFDLGHRRAIFLGAALVLAVSLLGATRLRVGTQQIEAFRADAPVRVDFEAVNQRLEGVTPLLVVVESDAPEAFKEPENLRELLALEEWLVAQPEIGGASTLVDYLTVVHRGIFGAEQPAIPATRRAVSQLFLIGGSDQLGRFVDRRFETTALHLRTRVADSDDVMALRRRIEARLAALPRHLEAHVSGTSVVLAGSFDAIMRGQARSILAALGIIYLLLAALFVSPRTGFLALLPNLLPVAAFFGALGWTGIRLNTGTSLVAPMVLGIAVDDTIHYFTRFLREARARGEERSATVAALRSVGRPVTVTTAALCAGFLVLHASELRNQAQLGSLAAFALAAAWLTDVVLTPALCSGLRVVTLWDLLSIDLGRHPEQRIRLFRGLRPAQARIVALLGSLLPVRTGERLFRTGEPGEALYVVVEGELRASLPGEGEALEIARHESGDVFGEVGLFHRARTADVTALSEARLLRLTREQLDDLGASHPRIAAVVFRNLNETLAERLARTTQRLRVAHAGEAPSAALEAGERALEGAFFDAGTERWRAALEAAPKADPAAAALAAVGVSDPALASRLSALGLHAEAVAALVLVPLVEVAWADGRIDAAEREALLAGAVGAGIEAASPAHGLLRHWLDARPPAELFHAWRTLARQLACELSIEGRLRLGAELAARARAVAEAAGGFLGLAAVSRREEQVLGSIARSFDPADASVAAPCAENPYPPAPLAAP